MKKPISRWTFLIVSLVVPLLYLSMYFPIWNGKEFLLANADIGHVILFTFQCICLVLAILQLLFPNFRNSDHRLLTLVFAFLFVCSLTLTCFVGFFFMLELFNIPWFPAQR